MKQTTTISKYLKTGIVHLVVGIIAMNILYSATTNTYMSRWDLYTNYLIVFAFYVHSLWLLPLLTIQGKTKKYLILTLISFFILTYTLVWLEAMESSELVTTVDGKPLSADYFFFQIQWLVFGLLTGLAFFVPFSLCSSLYHVLLMNKSQRKTLASFKYSEVVANGIIVLSVVLFTLVSANNMRTAGVQNALQVTLFFCIFYFNVFVLVPALLSNRRVLSYIGLNLLSIVVILLGTKLIYELPFEKVLPFSRNFNVLMIIAFVIFLSAFVYAYVRLKFKANERLFDLKLTAKESELQLLKSQVNPHFLFNTLNTLYATSLKEQAPKTAQSITKLGSLIRYMQNDIHKELIPLQKEVDYLNDYIEIQKLRLAIEPEIITTFENIDAQMMSPGLFIPLVENAFKYGIHPTEKSTIHIRIQCSDRQITFECENNYDPNQKVHAMNEGFGIGIQNVQKRLKLVYPEKHTFDIDKSATRFVVKLTLDLT